MQANFHDVLQPLRIPAGWRIDYNLLTEFDPSPETATYFYGEWLFVAFHTKFGVGLEVSFSPEGDPQGAFMIDYYQVNKKARGSGSSQEMLECFSTTSRKLAVQAIEQLMATGSLPGFCSEIIQG